MLNEREKKSLDCVTGILQFVISFALNFACTKAYVEESQKQKKL